ncbi:hypothetical protein [Streptomonospora arabica]|uniref:Uncharacterized protein n=1 Tax=Streptomonospora arabica TaxID=412417 RepID=A0ABV9SSQ9_9ACTN
MSAGTEPVYRHVIGGGPGEIIPPERLHEVYADHWHVRCYLWCGSEYWAAKRRHPVPAEAEQAGVREGVSGWYSAAWMRDWLNEQGRLWDAWSA